MQDVTFVEVDGKTEIACIYVTVSFFKLGAFQQIEHLSILQCVLSQFSWKMKGKVLELLFLLYRKGFSYPIFHLYSLLWRFKRSFCIVFYVLALPKSLIQVSGTSLKYAPVVVLTQVYTWKLCTVAHFAKIVTIRDFHLPGLFFCFSTRIQYFPQTTWLFQ